MLDEPTAGVDLLARDGVLSLLRSLADEGIAVLIGTGESSGLSGADRALSLAEGELRGSPRPSSRRSCLCAAGRARDRSRLAVGGGEAERDPAGPYSRHRGHARAERVVKRYRRGGEQVTRSTASA